MRQPRPAGAELGVRVLIFPECFCILHNSQNSVFECLLNASQYAVLKAELTALIDPALDSLRFYQLGNNYQSKVEHVGLHPDFAQDDVLMF